MTEREYITATNLTKLRIISAAMKEIMDGDQWGVNTETYQRAYSDILDMQEKLFDVIKITEE